MIQCVLYLPRKEEGKRIFSALRERAAYFSGEEWDFKLCTDSGHDLESSAIESTALCWDVSEKRNRELLTHIREMSRKAYLLVLASADTSPLTFLNPTIAPSSLILRPLCDSELRRVSGELIRALQEQKEAGGPCLAINSKQESRKVPYSGIYYFEARDKKLFARLRGEELGFAGTLDQLESNLPEYFRRCHRSFIVNTNKIDRIQLSDNTILLWDGIALPLSRGYKRSIKELYHGHD